MGFHGFPTVCVWQSQEPSPTDQQAIRQWHCTSYAESGAEVSGGKNLQSKRKHAPTDCLSSRWCVENVSLLTALSEGISFSRHPFLLTEFSFSWYRALLTPLSLDIPSSVHTSFSWHSFLLAYLSLDISSKCHLLLLPCLSLGISFLASLALSSSFFFNIYCMSIYVTCHVFPLASWSPDISLFRPQKVH